MAVVAGPPTNTVTGDPWAQVILPNGSPYMPNMETFNENYRPLPPWRGTGYIAGDSPDGLVTFNGSGTVRTVDLFDRETNIYIGSTTSAADGTYMFSGVDIRREFDVRARGVSSIENDLIAARINGKIIPLAITGAFTTPIFVGLPSSSFVNISGGAKPYSNARVTDGLAPAGMVFTIGGGNTVVMSGVCTSAASSTFTVSVDSADGQTASSVQTVVSVINAHRYWRVLINATGSDKNPSVAEVEFRETPGGASLCVGGTAIASAIFSTEFPASAAFDGDVNTRWAQAASFGLPAYIGYLLATPSSVAEVAIRAANNAPPTAENAPIDFAIQYSDNGTAWTNLKSFPNETGWLSSQLRVYGM